MYTYIIYSVDKETRIYIHIKDKQHNNLFRYNCIIIVCIFLQRNAYHNNYVRSMFLDTGMKQMHVLLVWINTTDIHFSKSRIVLLNNY